MNNDIFNLKTFDDFPFISGGDIGNQKFIVYPQKGNNIARKIYQDFDEKDGLAPGQEEEIKEFNTYFASLQSWFIRIAHHEKLKFVLKLLKSFVRCSNTNALIDVMDPITKDLIYAKTQFTHTKHDITPLDHNRCLTTIPLAEVISNSLLWFSELYKKEQISVMIILLKLSGSAITFHFYMEAVKYIDHDENNLDDIKKHLLQYSFIRDILDPINDIEKSVNRSRISVNKSRISVNKSRISINKSHMSVRSKRNHQSTDRWSSAPGKGRGTSIPYDDLSASFILEKKVRNWEKHFGSLLNESGIFNENNIRLKPLVTDMVQLLPISVNRAIYSKLDQKSRKNLNLINKYWSKSSRDIQKELNTRTWLNENLKEWKYKFNNYKARSFVLNTDNKDNEKKDVLSKSSKSAVDKYSIERVNASIEDFKEYESQVIPYLVFILENKSIEKLVDWIKISGIYTAPKNGEKEDMSNLQIKEMIPLLDREHSKMNREDPYKGKYIISEICSRFDHKRCIAVNSRWIAMSDESNITLHSLLTGVPSPCQLIGHTGDVTALFFHRSKSRLFSGSSDTTVKCWSLYSRVIIATYIGHTSIILDISANEKYLVSLSVDKTLRIFEIDNGLEIWQYTFYTIPTVVTIGHELDFCFGMLDGVVIMVDLKCEQINKKGKERILISFEISLKIFDSKSILLAHKGRVTCILLEMPFLITGGSDGFVYVWYYDHKNGHMNVIATLNHKKKYVSSIALSFMKVLTTADDGKLRIWDIYNSNLKRVIVVNPLRKVILSMKCLGWFDHTKVIINNEDGLKSIEFAHYWVKQKNICMLKNKKEPRYIRGQTRIITSKPADVISTFQYKEIRKEPFDYKCKMNLLLRNAAMPSIVKPKKQDRVTFKEVSIISKAALTEHKLLLFPRINPPISFDDSIIPLKKEMNDGFSVWRRFPPSTKGILPANNPSKKTF